MSFHGLHIGRQIFNSIKKEFSNGETCPNMNGLPHEMSFTLLKTSKASRMRDAED